MAVATASVFSHTDALVKTWSFTDPTPKYTLVVQDDVVGVTITNTPGITARKVTEIGPYEISEPTEAGVGNDKATSIGQYAAGVAIDGTFTFREVVSSGATPVPTSTPQGTPVFLTAGGQLTLVDTSNTRVGTVNYSATYQKAAGKLPIAIGL